MAKQLHDETTTLNLMAEVQSGLLDYEPCLKQSMVIDGAARRLTWDFSKINIETLEILQMTDVQFGHKACDTATLDKYLAWVLSQENRYVLFGGDMVDAGHVQSKGSPFEQIGDPQQELWSFCKLFAPVRHRVLGYVGGNHERRSIPTFGDIGKSIATILELPYSPGKQHIDIIFGDHKPFKISMWHGGGSGQTKGSIANGLVKFMNQSDSQLYLLGHLHQAMVVQESREVRDKTKMKLQKIVGARGSSFLKHYGTYAEVIMGANPQTIQMPRAVLERNGHWELTLR
jgi:Calcineurin-like phosphoesterase